MNSIVSISLIAVGIALLVMGVVAMDSFSSDVSRFFTGTPTDKSVWMVIGGIVALIAGGAGMTLFRSNSVKS